MMVKNEELHLERCLESLKPILKRRDVQLIIVDTGSSDKTIRIAKKYTDFVYEKEWFNDFSGMRNVSVSYATGEWIFIVDADEAIENLDCLEKFLIDDNENNINTYFIKAKNYSNIKNTDSYSMVVTPRIFRNDGEFRYEGKVHNQPIYKKPVGYLDLVMGHYGYVTMNKEIMDKKFIRTKKLLEEELYKDPQNLYYLYQLATSYSMHGDAEEAYKISKDTYKLLLKKSKEEQLSGFAVFGIHLSSCIILEKHSELLDAALKSIKLRNDYIDGYFYAIYAYDRLGNIEMAKKYCEKYIDIYTKFNTLPISKNDGIAIYKNDRATLKTVKALLISYHVRKEQYTLAIKYLDKQDVNLKNIGNYIDIYYKLNKYDDLIDLVTHIEDKDLKIAYLDSLENKIKLLDNRIQEYIRNEFVNLDLDYALYCKFKLLSNNEVDSKLEISNKIYKNMDYKKPNIYYADILCFLIEKSNLNLNLFTKFNRVSIFYFINYFYKESYNNVYVKVVDWAKDFNSKQLIIKNLFTLKNILEAITVNLIMEYRNTGIDNTLNDNMVIFTKYIEVGLEYISVLYDIDGLSIKYDYINDLETKFLAILHLYRENLNKGNLQVAFSYYKLAAETYPEMADFLKEYINSQNIEFEFLK